MVQGSHPERDGFLELLAVVSIAKETLGDVGDDAPTSCLDHPTPRLQIN